MVGPSPALRPAKENACCNNPRSPKGRFPLGKGEIPDEVYEDLIWSVDGAGKQLKGLI